MSIKDLSDLSGISESTIRRIEAEEPDGYKTQFDVAMAISEALESQTHTLFDSIELSHLGRPAKTGRPIADLEAKRKEHIPRCSQPGCNEEVSRAEAENNLSDCHRVALVS